MKIQIEVPDRMVRDIERRTRQKFNAAEIEEAARVYYAGLCEFQISPQTWSAHTKRSVYGHAIDTSCPF